MDMTSSPRFGPVFGRMDTDDGMSYLNGGTRIGWTWFLMDTGCEI